MKYAALVARREYLENVKTKGFWIGIMAFPIFIFLMIQVIMKNIISPLATSVLSLFKPL